MTGNPFTSIPAVWRGRIYLGYGALVLTAGGIQTAFAAIPHTSPTWLRVTTAVVAYIGVPVTGTAAANIGNTDGREN